MVWCYHIIRPGGVTSTHCNGAVYNLECFFQNIETYGKWIETSSNLLETRNKDRKVISSIHTKVGFSFTPTKPRGSNCDPNFENFSLIRFLKIMTAIKVVPGEHDSQLEIGGIKIFYYAFNISSILYSFYLEKTPLYS